MVRIFVLALISLFFSVLKIYADCNLPTGGACKIEDLRKEQEAFSKKLPEDNVFLKTDEQSIKELIEKMQKDLQEQVNLKNINKNN